MLRARPLIGSSPRTAVPRASACAASYCASPWCSCVAILPGTPGVHDVGHALSLSTTDSRGDVYVHTSESVRVFSRVMSVDIARAYAAHVHVCVCLAARIRGLA